MQASVLHKFLQYQLGFCQAKIMAVPIVAGPQELLTTAELIMKFDRSISLYIKLGCVQISIKCPNPILNNIPMDFILKYNDQEGLSMNAKIGFFNVCWRRNQNN